uniref:VHS domain-containing protein n=1 Tax=Ciona savignyi TaxID=51511 RepID=H2ZH92_CIOSA
MGLFGNQNPFEESLDKVTNELNTDVDWGAIIALCDKVKTTSKGPADFTTLILQKINHKVPHVSMQAITVLDACVNNCGKDFHKEIASQHFTDGLRDIIYNYKVKKVVLRLCYFIKKWAEDFKDDPELSHFVSFYYRHRGEGIQFPDTEDDSATSTKNEPVSSDPNVVSSQQEEDDIAKAVSSSRKLVKALYDFEAAEDNELTFRAGDLITILDD